MTLRIPPVISIRHLLSHARPEEAHRLFDRALELSPDDLTARELLQQITVHDTDMETRTADAFVRERRISEALAR
jgi:Tfp pilus assembly protein FimV